MADDREARIRMRAHEIWEREGRPDGQEARQWEEAAREIDSEDGAEGNGQEEQDLASSGTPPASKPAAPSRTEGRTPARTALELAGAAQPSAWGNIKHSGK